MYDVMYEDTYNVQHTLRQGIWDIHEALRIARLYCKDKPVKAMSKGYYTSFTLCGKTYVKEQWYIVERG